MDFELFTFSNLSLVQKAYVVGTRPWWNADPKLRLTAVSSRVLPNINVCVKQCFPTSPIKKPAETAT